MFAPDDTLSKTRVELYTTSTASDIKTKKDCYRLRSLLEAKKISFYEIDLAVQLWMRRKMLLKSEGRDILPQLHAYGKFIGDLSQVQELEDFGELDDAIQSALEEAYLSIPQQHGPTALAGPLSSESPTSSPEVVSNSEEDPACHNGAPVQSGSEASEPGILDSDGSASLGLSSGSSPLPSPPSSPLRGIQSTGSLADLDGSQEDSSLPASQDLQSESSSAASREARPPEASGSSLEDWQGSTAAFLESQGRVERTSSQSQDSEELSPLVYSMLRYHANELPSADLRQAAAMVEEDLNYNSQGSHADISDSSSQQEAEPGQAHDITAYPIEPTTGSESGTAASNAPPSPWAEEQGSKASSTSSQAGMQPKILQLAGSEGGRDSESDPWDAASSDDGSQRVAAACMPSRSASGLTGAADQDVSSTDVASAQISRRRSSGSSFFRGADRATEQAASPEDIFALHENGLSPDRRYQIADSLDGFPPSDSPSSPQLAAKHSPEDCNDLAITPRDRSKPAVAPVSLSSGGGWPPPANGVDITSPETQEILASLQSRKAGLGSRSDSEDCLNNVMSGLAIASDASSGP